MVSPELAPMQNRLLIGPPAVKLDSASLFTEQQCFIKL
jgi:hypothetical protein